MNTTDIKCIVTFLLAGIILVVFSGAGKVRAKTPDVISEKVYWQDRVELREDLLITETGHLTINPGTEIIVYPSERTRTDPQFFSTDTEIVVRGRLEVLGDADSGVIFRKAEREEGVWAGIIADGPGASISLDKTFIKDAHSGLTVINASLGMKNSKVSGCRYGVTILGNSTATMVDSHITKNDYGLADYSSGAKLINTVVSGSIEKDYMDKSALAGYQSPPWYKIPYRQGPKEKETEYLGEHSIAEDTTWQGRIVIRGQVVVQPEADLTIAPGTEVAFRRIDTNGDGLGESLLLILGTIKVSGTPENWVLFTSAEDDKKVGDWDKVSLIASESKENFIRYARFEYGYQAFHNHFSNVKMTGVIFNNNYRGVQFQESGATSIKGGFFWSNKSAMRFRDSHVELADCLVEANISGINFLRCRCSITNTVITGNLSDPLLGRESDTRLEAVMINTNKEGPRFKGDGSHLVMLNSSVYHNLEDGLSLTNTEADITGSVLSFNGLDGLSTTNGQVKISKSVIRDNGRWAVDNNGEDIVDARDIYWGEADADNIESSIYDRRDNMSLGRVLFQPYRKSPQGLFFAGLMPEGKLWAGEIMVIGDFQWPKGRNLEIAPGAVVRFYPQSNLSPLDFLRQHPNFEGSEINVLEGSLKAIGNVDMPIRFKPAVSASDIDSWGGINLEKVADASFKYCSFEKAETALHLRESKAFVENCLFVNNNVGLRFNMSPITIRNNGFLDNETGIRFHFGEPLITGNLFRGNMKAIFVSRDPGNFKIVRNNFIDNEEYNISLGELVEIDMDVKENYWGTVNEEEIEDKIFDAHDYAHLGKVKYRPLADHPWDEPKIPSPDK